MTQILLQEILEPTIVAAIVSGFISLVGVSLTAFAALRTNDRQIQIENITKERAKWRGKIRKMSIKVQQASASGETEKLKEILLKFKLNLNPFDKEDDGILVLIKSLSKRKDDSAIWEFSNRVCLLLKHDWERGKYESKPWVVRVFITKPVRVKYEEFLKMASSSELYRILNDRDGQERLGVAVACGLLLFVVTEGLLPPIMNLTKPLLWVGFILYGCLWASKFQVFFAKNPILPVLTNPPSDSGTS